MRITKEAAERRQEILDTALTILLEKGYEKTSVKDIVSTVGVAQGLFYYYFPSKEDMVHELCLQLVESYSAYLNDQGLKNCHDALQAVRLMISGTFSFLNEQRPLILKMHEKGNKPLHDMFVIALIFGMSRILAGVIALGNAQCQFDCSYPEQSAGALVAGLFNAMHDDSRKILLDNVENDKEFLISYVSRVLLIDRKALEKVI
jgi:AcrR family transcriptional regulator